ncbi:MAG: hypothetical protein WAV54_03245 [Acidimicrobiales bacterium]
MPEAAFFAYPATPPVSAQVIRDAAVKVRQTGLVSSRTWEDLRTSGTLVIDTILEAIRRSDLICAEVTSLNANVLFELGFAITAGKNVWPLYDSANSEAERNWQRFRLLTTIGYVPYINSDDIRAQFLREVPHLRPSLYETVIRPNLSPSAASDLFYLRSPIATDASRQLNRRLDRETLHGCRLITYDPAEGSLYPLTWFAQQVYDASAVIVHLSPSRHSEALISNARASLVAGMAKGFDRNLLLVLEEQSELSPLDYRDLSYTYRTPSDLIARVDEWLNAQTFRTATSSSALPALSLATELKSLDFGEPVAENEADQLASYFVETASYREVLNRSLTIFVGRKGAGKSANFLRAADTMRSQPRNLVCVIQPSGYELASLVRLLAQFHAEDERMYAVEALWQYLLVTEIVRTVAADLSDRLIPVAPESPQAELIDYADRHELNNEFAVRLERAVASALGNSGESIEERRADLARRMHQHELAEVRELLSAVLGRKDRVCILIDNLDKAWTRTADLDQLAHLLLGLLTSVQRLRHSFARSDSRRHAIDLSLAVFLRSDIFEKVASLAAEPDKLPISRLVWTDNDLLLRVIEERYVATHSSDSRNALWERFFTPEVNGEEVRSYILGRVLPRPRDIVQFCSFALASAIDAGHSRIEETDLVDATRSYSQFAFEALLVENGLTIRELEAVLFEFAGSEPRIAQDWVADAITRAGLPETDRDRVIARLRQLSFLGREVRDDTFAYEEDGRDEARLGALARNLEDQRGWPSRYEIHPAYRAYLDIAELRI